MKHLKKYEAYYEHQTDVYDILNKYQSELDENPITEMVDVKYHMQNLRTLYSDMQNWDLIENDIESALMDMIKPIKESSGYNPSMTVDIKNQYAKIKEGPKGGMIDIGKVGQVADATLKNLKKEYPDAFIKIIKDRYVMILKK